jgi:ABC-type glycerol-3-phosphate transport system substrate-binding protein
MNGVVDMNNALKKFLWVVLLVFMLACFANLQAATSDRTAEAATTGGIALDENSYVKYLSKYSTSAKPNKTIPVDATSGYTFDAAGTDAEVVVGEFDGKTGILLPEEGTVSYNITVSETGLYNLKIEYYAILDYQGVTISRSAAIDRGLLIDDKSPFTEANNFILHRLWEDKFNVTKARIEGKNDIKPSQIEKPVWQERVVQDMNGYYDEPYYFYLTAGTHKISFVANREPVVIRSFAFGQFVNIKSYAQVKESYASKGLSSKSESFLAIEGEDATSKTSPTLAPVEDNSSSRLSPYRRFKVSYNTIGGYNWRIVGDAITWTVPEGTEEGLYALTFKVKQNFTRGMFSTRTLYINGEIPFEEMKTIEFPYRNDWQNVTLGTKDEPYLFHLKAGDEITLEVSSGRYAELIRQIDQLIADLNLLYREIVMITSVSPSPTLDYLLASRIDGLYERIESAKNVLNSVIKGVESIAGRGENIGPLERMLVLLKRFDRGEREITRGLSTFKQNISSLGTWTTSMKEQPLSIDLVYLHGTDVKLPRAKSNIFERIWRGIILFFGSFFVDQSLTSSVDGTGPTITVWISSGRDQANILRQLIDETFTPDKGINVDLKLVNAGVLLPATVSGNGPDVSLGVGEETPVNWGVRNAMYDLSTFADYDDVAQRFYPSALLPLSFEGAVYGLPEQQNFLVMFYRKDILEEIGVTSLPKTWDDVINLIPILQQKNLEFYLPNVSGGLNPILYALIRQNDGKLYTDDNRESALMETKARDAFIQFTKFYADYKFVQNASFINRFRTGEMPIGISYYTEYNTLSVFAPEIRGLWGFAPIPGTVIGYDETNQPIIDNSTTSSVSAAVMLKATKHPNESWEFLKWWTSKDTQIRYGRELEAIIGAAARYPTANVEALANLPWPTSDYKVLRAQMEKSNGVPVVVGSYIIGRYIDNAFRAVINDKANPNDSLYINVLKINKELARKRKEFGLE